MPGKASPTIFSPLRHRDFTLMWSGFVVSHVGDSVQLYAQAWLVTELTRSGFKVGMVAVAQALPRLILGLFSGVLVDRVDKRRLLIATQTLAMLQSIVFLGLVATGRITYAAIVVLAALLGVFDTLNLNARVALLPTLIPRDLIGKGVALQALGVNAVQIAGPGITAILIGATGIVGCLAANVASFVVLLAALVFMRAPTRATRTHAVNFARELSEGFAFVRARPLLWASILLAYLVGFFGVAIARLLALYARVVIGTDARGFGMLAVAIGAGAIVASVLVTARARPSSLPRNIVVAAFGFSLALAAVSRAQHFVPALAALACLGAGQMAFRSAITTAIQLETPDRLRGRVISLLTLDFALWSLGAMFVGAFADRLAFARAARLGVLAVGVRDPALLPGSVAAWALGVTLLSTAALCALSVAALARTILRARLSPAPELSHDQRPS